MRRQYFGAAGERLNARELAHFIVASGVAPAAVAGILGARPVQTRIHDIAVASLPPVQSDWLAVDLDSARHLGISLPKGADLRPLREAISEFWNSIKTANRLSLLLMGGNKELDRAWLAALLANAGEADAVVFEIYRPDVAALDWPLTLGLPDEADGRRLGALLEQGRFRELFNPLVAPGDLQVDILLFPGDLSDALGDSCPQAYASVVLVLGNADLPTEQVTQAMERLSYERRAAIVAVCGWAAPDYADRIQDMVALLAHNTPLPQALFQARAGDEWQKDADSLPPRGMAAPLVFGDLAFAMQNRPVDVGARLAEELHRAGGTWSVPLDDELREQLDLTERAPDADSVASALEKHLADWTWQREHEGATRLARVRRNLDRALGPVDLRRVPWSLEGRRMTASPPSLDPFDRDDVPVHLPDSAAEATPEGSRRRAGIERHVKADVLAPGSAGPPAEPPLLLPNVDYRLQVFIAPLDVRSHTTVGKALDETLLPEREDGHELTIVYCPLSPVRRGKAEAFIPKPSLLPLHLPRTGSSKRVEFHMLCGEDPTDFRARIIVLHENRVLQTLRLSAGDDGHSQLELENIYVPGFDSPSAAAPADLTFVINDDPGGRPGLTTVAPKRVSFLEPDNLGRAIQAMQRLLSRGVVDNMGVPVSSLDDESSICLMRKLANYGAVILEELKAQHGSDLLSGAERVQVVEAVDKSYFPVEFLYSGIAPRPDSHLCPNAPAALAPGAARQHDECPRRNDEDYVCPLSFWGFCKAIERHGSNNDPAHVISVPQPGEGRLGPFVTALVAGSDRAREQLGPAGVPRAIGDHVHTVGVATSWRDWRDQIRNRHPDLLVLMPHSLDSTHFPGIPALEISLDELAASNLSEEYVRTAEHQGPLVLLIGCSTQVTELPFLNFVKQFNRRGAPAVIGTLAVIYPAQANHVIRRLLEIMNDAHRPPARLDEALLYLRRDLLAAGSPLAFMLTAYGHCAWRI